MSKKTNIANDQKYRAGVITALAQQCKPMFRTAIEASLVKQGIAVLSSYGNKGEDKYRVNGLCAVLFPLLDEGLIELGPKEGNRLTYVLTAKGQRSVK